MNKFLGQYYVLILTIIWTVGVPMGVKLSHGFVVSLCATVVCSLIAYGIQHFTVQRSNTTKLLALLTSVVILCAYVGLFVERPAPEDELITIEVE